MKIGLIGPENSGKTTIFNVLTGAGIETAPYHSDKAEPHLGIVEVTDERITLLSEMYNPKKTIYAQIEYIDFAGLSSGAAQSGLFSANSMSEIKNADALALVVRNFSDEILDGTQGASDPFNDMLELDSELIIADMIIAEKRLEKLELNLKRGVKSAEDLFQKKTIEKAIDALENEIPLRSLELAADEIKTLRGFQFLSLKPMMVILNSGDDNFGENDELISRLETKYKTIEFSGEFEMELLELEEEEATAYMEDAGITESAKVRLTKFSYELLGYTSFFTVGTDEVRAWTIVNGDNAVTAAGKIHSDLARGFIRAETFSYYDLIELGSERALREKGKFRLEGKEYKVKDGDILNIRFSV